MAKAIGVLQLDCNIHLKPIFPTVEYPSCFVHR